MADIIQFAPHAAAAPAALDGINHNPTPDDFINSEIGFLEALRLEINDIASLPVEMSSFQAMDKGLSMLLQKEMADRGYYIDRAKGSAMLAAEITGLYRHAIRQIVYLAAAAEMEAPPKGVA